MNTRRSFLKTAGSAVLGAGLTGLYGGCSNNNESGIRQRPNVILIMTDDQGFGDVGFHDNDIIKTPNLDRFAEENLEFSRFYVCPVCTPTRAGLMTGRYHHRTGTMGVMCGECLINPEEKTIAGYLGEAGYSTGIFGKWHLGDNYPRRPMDMGFGEMLTHNAGGLSQPSCPPGVGYGDPEHEKKYDYATQKDRDYNWMSTNNYFDPVLNHNGEETKYEGYCTDIFFNESIKFIEKNADRPFFVYLPLNAPHCPEIVSEHYAQKYRDMGVNDHTARIYGMVENIDENFGKLQSKLDELGLTGNTMVIFFCDNGPFGRRFNGGLRGAKASFYEGGIRSPFVISWPDGIKSSGKCGKIAANIDLLPTILDACNVEQPIGRKLDGRSLLPLMEDTKADWPERTLFFQGNSGIPEKYNQCAAVTQRYKLVNGTELYDLTSDQGETENIAAANSGIVARMRADYEAWFEDVTGSVDFGSQRLWIGTDNENPVRLTRSDWKGPKARFIRKDTYGWWEIDVRKTGSYVFDVNIEQPLENAVLHFMLDGIDKKAALKNGAISHRFGPFDLKPGEAKLGCRIEKGDNVLGVYNIMVTRL